MADRTGTDVFVISGDGDLVWEELARPEGDVAPPGFETILFRSADGAFSCGLWKRDPEEGDLAPPFDEIMCFLRGEVLVTDRDGGQVRLGPGDALAAPNGSASRWRSLAPMLKFWAVYHGESDDRPIGSMMGNQVPWRPSQIPADDGFDPGREAVVFERGAFAAGFWERDRQDRDFERTMDEVAVLLHGAVDLTSASGESLHAGPGDVIVTPRGSRGHWTSRLPVRKFWASYEA